MRQTDIANAALLHHAIEEDGLLASRLGSAVTVDMGGAQVTFEAVRPTVWHLTINGEYMGTRHGHSDVVALTVRDEVKQYNER